MRPVSKLNQPSRLRYPRVVVFGEKRAASGKELCSIEKLGPLSARESSCGNNRRERCAPDDSDEEDGERSKNQRWNPNPAEDVVIVFNDSARHCPSAKKGGVVDRVSPSRIHKKQIAGDQPAQITAPCRSRLRIKRIFGSEDSSAFPA
jgi:hypothetical protein